jgi:hypothetical protein
MNGTVSPGRSGIVKTRSQTANGGIGAIFDPISRILIISANLISRKRDTGQGIGQTSCSRNVRIAESVAWWFSSGARWPAPGTTTSLEFGKASAILVDSSSETI